jgi:hypothetical protein
MRPRILPRTRTPRWLVVVTALALPVSCTSPASCEEAAPDPACPDLRFSGHLYDEWRAYEPRPILQELGDAAYPACNDAELCGPDLGGFAATDVWLLEGVDVDEAILGYRQNTETYVIFVRRGLDPRTIAGMPQAAG